MLWGAFDAPLGWHFVGNRRDDCLALLSCTATGAGLTALASFLVVAAGFCCFSAFWLWPRQRRRCADLRLAMGRLENLPPFSQVHVADAIAREVERSLREHVRLLGEVVVRVTL